MTDIDVQELYQELILDHSRRPRNFRRLDGATNKAEGYNPLCGDRVTVYLRMNDDDVSDAAFQGEGCAISKASASLMTESVKGKTRAEVESLFSRFHDAATGSGAVDTVSLGKLAVFSGLRGFPTRVKCATLAWHTLRAALEQKDNLVV
ncbi:MAG: SUF system NifU family Fe-S cluster assembly protein [Acidobacteria bacterium]|nr:MAG: SUF system NifU family Fe-S cluster assembly protein [Acidobacteriota bacterium]